MNCKEHPYANICLTNSCNLRCYYCQSGGENHGICGNKNLELSNVKQVLNVLEKAGIDRIRFTGGEPTLLPYFGEIIRYAVNLRFSKIRISTNGYKISEYVDILKNKKIRVQLSLDTLEKQKFESITGYDELETVIKSIDTLSKSNINTRINIVVMKSNISEIKDIIEYCNEKNFSIKLLGLELLDCYDKNRVLDELVDYDDRKALLGSIGRKYNEIMAPGQLGIPMGEYKNGNISIRVRFFDGWGATYIDSCKKCSVFPCPSGIYGVQILANGEISLCRFRRNLKFNFLECIDENEIYIKLKEMLDKILSEKNKIEQTEAVTFGTEKFIKIPESLDNYKM